MSAETVLPPEGPVGPDKQQHGTSLLLVANPQGTCQTDAKRLPDTTETSTTPSSRDRCADGQEGLNRDDLTNGDPIRELSGDVAPSCPVCLQVHWLRSRSFREASDHSGVTREPK
ncbi:hypothetical protein Baya_0109 [Bagarius yarrelli]|uniref:Uncharacterized protein n=1 Tax=Bagarius yarrelli TaxID=175774 RepID=A0A556THA6_BAGYA|nr:hypothetical protein Baya_0109 [Bagarius yarrelli]